MVYLSVLAVLCTAQIAAGNSFSADGSVFEPSHEYSFRPDRTLIDDGSFEGGTCVNTPIWLCTADNSCDWIADLVPLGLWNYDGYHVAWLGGFCGGIPTCTASICEDAIVGGCGMFYWWMAYVNDAVMRVFVTIDGDTVYEFYPQLSDHLLDYQPVWVDKIDYTDGAEHTLCFNMENPGCLEGLGDNYFLDYVEVMANPTALDALSLSCVKALY